MMFYGNNNQKNSVVFSYAICHIVWIVMGVSQANVAHQHNNWIHLKIIGSHWLPHAHRAAWWWTFSNVEMSWVVCGLHTLKYGSNQWFVCNRLCSNGSSPNLWCKKFRFLLTLTETLNITMVRSWHLNSMR